MKLSYKYHTFNISLRLLRLLKRRMRWVRAAGGIVTAPDGTMLLIQRNGRWDLPKGKVEPGETLLQAALREVEEETGVSVQCSAFSVVGRADGIPQRFSPTGDSLLNTYHLTLNTIKTYHVFNLYGGWHLKQTSWFPMTAEKSEGIPQQEEGITAIEWVAPDEWHRRLQSSYGTLRTLSLKLKSKN